jgi:hypothetical protein
VGQLAERVFHVLGQIVLQPRVLGLEALNHGIALCNPPFKLFDFVGGVINNRPTYLALLELLAPLAISA